MPAAYLYSQVVELLQLGHSNLGLCCSESPCRTNEYRSKK